MAFGYGYGDFPVYVPVAQRLADGRRKLAKQAKTRGRPVAPVTIEGRTIASTFWGKAWCENLERYSDFASRLPRGRTYVRNGSVLDLHISQGLVEAHVAGSELYTVTIALGRLAAPRWKKVIASCTGKIGSLIGLLRGELSGEVLAVLTDARGGLFPAPHEITLDCSCPDDATMCKHVAAVLSGVGARLDERPELFFVLRQVDQAELIAGGAAADVLAAAGAKAGAKAGGRGKKRIAAGAVASVFGIELDDGAPVPPVKKAAAKKPATKKPATKKSAARPAPRP
jgi:uncharacterized Zn finger protein